MKNFKHTRKLLLMAVLALAITLLPVSSLGVSAKRKPVYTGDKYVDYMAEDMLKSAGVKSSMSQDKKVRKIYHYMTTHFKHVEGSQKVPKNKYNFKKLSKKIDAFKVKTDKRAAKGKIKIKTTDYFVYTYYYNIAWYMKHRCGVCTHQAIIFEILCQHAGVKAGICSGYYKNRSGKLSGHSWNYAVVGGKKYYYDVDVEIKNYGKGQGDYYWYKKTKSQANKTHIFD